MYPFARRESACVELHGNARRSGPGAELNRRFEWCDVDVASELGAVRPAVQNHGVRSGAESRELHLNPEGVAGLVGREMRQDYRRSTCARRRFERYIYLIHR